MLSFRTDKHWRQWWATTLIAALFVILLPVVTVRATDISKDNFLANTYYNILISDADFTAIDSMSEAAIQQFLTNQNSYLAQYSENGRSAAKIIYDAAHGYGGASGTNNGVVINTSTGSVSPKVILVTLQKEQSLITLTAADRALNVDQYNNRLNKAMGYACPDGSSCNPNYAGFTKQVENASWQLRYNYEIAGKAKSWWDQYYSAISTSVCQRQYYVGITCSVPDPTGSYSVTLTNKATASLYRYTPHVFNGNYNFWKLTNSWFSSTPATPPITVPTPNDTGSVSSKTYEGTFKLTGTKDSATTVVFNGKTVASSGTTRWTLQFTPDVGTKNYGVEYRNDAGQTVATKTITIERHVVGDINGDSKVDLLDLSLLGETFGQGVPDDDWRNLNPHVDSEVNILDLSLLADRWNG